MSPYTAAYKKAVAALSAPYREQDQAFHDQFSEPLFLIRSENSRGYVRSIVALCEEEIAPLSRILRSPHKPHHLPFPQSSPKITIQTVSIEEITSDDPTSDPRNGNAFEGLTKDVYRELTDRLRHLTSFDFSKAESWVWEGMRPHPIIDGKLHYVACRMHGFVRKDEDRLFTFPLRTRDELIEYRTTLDFVPPSRLALTLPNGNMQAFEVDEGFVGPDDFVWLRALQNINKHSRATYEGVRKGDIQQTDSPKLITGTHAYGPSWEDKSLIRVTPQGWSLVPYSLFHAKDTPHSLALMSRGGCTSDGPWMLGENGARPFGKWVDQVASPWWGYAIKGHIIPHKWQAALLATCNTSPIEFDEEPKLGPLSDLLMGKVDGLWGAICLKTGQQRIAFEFQEYRELMSPNDGTVMIHKDGSIYGFDETGTQLVGPLAPFETPKKYWDKRQQPFFSKGKDDEEKLHYYLQFDVARMIGAVKRQRRFGDLDPFAKTLAAYAGRLEAGRKDADLCGLWGARVKITKSGEIYGVRLKKGMTGLIGFGDVGPYGGSGMFGWLKELPVEGLMPESAGRVIGVPFDMLKIYK